MPFAWLIAFVAAIQLAAGLRVAEPPTHYINTRLVALDVKVVAGPSGLTRAALWAADDDRKAWKKVREAGPLPAPPADARHQQVIPVGFVYSAERDGAHRFVIVAESHRGPNRRTPMAGEPGDVRVVVDTTRPTVTVISARVGPGAAGGPVVDVRWQAEDANIAPAPIKLEYQAARKGAKPGEWKAITTEWVRNTGQYSWVAPADQGFEFLIRVTCRDLAGNQAHAVTVKPVNVDLAVPRVVGMKVSPRIEVGVVPKK